MFKDRHGLTDAERDYGCLLILSSMMRYDIPSDVRVSGQPVEDRPLFSDSTLIVKSCVRLPWLTIKEV